MAQRNITGFEAAPQGQIGSGFAQVFDTSNLVGAALQMQQMRQQQFDGLIASLAEIDPNLARPVDTDGIIRGVNSLQDYVIENYQAINDPRKDPSKAIEFRRRKNELLAVVNTSKQMGEKALELAKELPKNDYYMGAFDRNRELIESLQSTPALSIGEDGSIVRNNDAISLFNRRLSVGKGANEFATELANKFKPQFDPNNPNLQQVKLADGTFISLHPDRVTDQQADQIIDNSLMGGGIDGVAVVNSVLGFEAPYDALSETEKQVVRDAIRPSFLSRIDTKPITSSMRSPSNFGQIKREANIDDRVRNVVGVIGGQGMMREQLVGKKFAQSSDIIENVETFINDGGELVYRIKRKAGDKVSTSEFKVGKQLEDGSISLGEESQHESGLNQLVAVVNDTFNQFLGGDVKALDLEQIGGQLKSSIEQAVSSGTFEVRVAEEGSAFQLGERTLSEGQFTSELTGVINEGMQESNKAITAVDRIKAWAQQNGVNLQMEFAPKRGNDNVVVVKARGVTTNYDLTKEGDLSRFVALIKNTSVIPTSTPTAQRTVPVRSGQQAQGIGAKYN